MLCGRRTGGRAEWHLEFVTSPVVVATNLLVTCGDRMSVKGRDLGRVKIVESGIDMPRINPRCDVRRDWTGGRRVAY
jgi:hypothetical protein